jgi:DNA-binding NtrC family response regulator
LITKPVDLDRLVEELRSACRSPAAAAGPALDPPLLAPLQGLFALQEDVARLKNVDCSVLIQGETGTGKTMLARWLHDAGRRRERPFVDLNCAGLARDLVESELFGHERGAFTSAVTSKVGMFELADGGTLFLDEIGDIDAAVQPKLLKAIEEKRFRRMGSARELSVDVRVIAASHRDLREAARTERFRSDLYYRLSTVTVTIPALRERRDAIPALARELLAGIAAKLGRPAPELTADAESALVAHGWPGNVRELKNVLERTLHFTPERELRARDLRIERQAGPMETTTLRDAERSHIERALASHSHVAAAAKSLGISRSSMYAKMKAYGLAPGRTKANASES